MTTLLIDNYDSFTYNVYQYLCELGADVVVHRNDKITVEECLKLNPKNLVISPGPGHPKDGGISCDVIKAFLGKVPIFGVCLGHQAMFHLFGGDIVNSGEIVHGKTSPVLHDGKGCYRGIPDGFQATRYHSLVGSEPTLPDCLEITSKLENGLIMGVRHKQYTVEGVQFHPESVIAEHGMKLLANFLEWDKPEWSQMTNRP
eukprot:GFYU01013603.1.p1 GENE.GFYU01013603.1~~GFYU01013603.1.p1  ORF type:complete len:201 (+),score=47.79 GFYU01013603.1:117-719(+)